MKTFIVILTPINILWAFFPTNYLVDSISAALGWLCAGIAMFTVELLKK